MRVIKSPKFERKYKKLHHNQLDDINRAVQEIVNNPCVGQQKIGDLTGLYVYKFKMIGQLILLAYDVFNDGEIILQFLDFGTHENFYRDIKRIV